MKIAAKLLYEALMDQFEVEDARLTNEALVLQRPFFYTSGRVRGSGLLCIAQKMLESPPEGQCCILYVNGCAAETKGSNYICLNGDAAEIFNAVQAVFDRWDAWEEQLNQAMLDRRNIQEILQISCRFLGNPVILMGTDFSLVAQAGQERIPPEQRIFDPESVSLELINSLKQDSLYNSLQDSPAPFLYPGHILGWRSWNVNIERNGQFTHRIILAECGNKLREGDGWLLEKLGQYLSSLLDQESSVHRTDNRLSAIFTRILSDRTADDMEMSRQLSRMGWMAEDDYCCLALKIADASSGDSFTWLIRDYLKKNYPHSCSCVYQDAIVSYFNLSRMGCTLEEIAGELKYFIRECFLKAGYSRVLRGHANLRRQYLQARAALEIGGQRNPYQWIHHFSGVALDYLLDRSTVQMPAGMLCHEGLLALRDFDREHNTEYMRTLRAFLDLNLNAVQTARELFIHRSTFLYRIGKIKSILESSLDDPEELLYLSLSFRLLEREENEQ